MKSMETICSSHKSLYRDLSLYEDHEIRRAATHQLYCFAIEIGFGANGWGSYSLEILQVCS